MRRTMQKLILGATVLLCAFAAVPAPAQVTGLYYQEVAKDGRVYVFNTPEAFKAWSRRPARWARSITLIGRGENGDDAGRRERDRGRPLPLQAQPARLRPADAATRQDAVDDRLFYRDGTTNFVMKTGTVQICRTGSRRATPRSIPTGPTPTTPTALPHPPHEDHHRGQRHRLALQAAGQLGGRRHGIGVTQAGHRGESATVEQRPILEDAEVWWAKYPMATVWVGQGKAYFGRQELTSSGRQQFVDRILMSEPLPPGPPDRRRPDRREPEQDLRVQLRHLQRRRSRPHQPRDQRQRRLHAGGARGVDAVRRVQAGGEFATTIRRRPSWRSAVAI